MKKMFQNITRGLSEVVFPNICACCGLENTEYQRQLCSFCLQERFEDANPDNVPVSSDIILPEGVVAQHALWQFDKGGNLQDLLHLLKYEQLTGIGVDLGREMGVRIKKHPFLRQKLCFSTAVLLPVPLHYLKFRYRGFNQAFKIAQGFQQIWKDLSICDIKSVVRVKNTRTQTGLSLKRRRQNLRNAFKVIDPAAVEDKLVVIIDDVFTTGATTFELAHTVLDSGAKEIVVLTVAQA
jgi:ComF family protein